MSRRQEGAVGTSMPARWYSMSRDLETTWQDIVDVDGALAVVARYFDGFQREYKDGEAAIAASVFGFGRADDDFIEFGYEDTDSFSLAVEPAPRPDSWLERLVTRERGTYQLRSREQLERVVRDYFTLARPAFHQRLAELRRA